MTKLNVINRNITNFNVTKLNVTFQMLALFALSLAFTVIANAQSQRTFVSTSGSDANTASLCSTSNPCRGFAAALTVTTAGGEIIALTSGAYGPVEITKSVQITAPTGVYVAISALPGSAIGGTDAIRVNAGSNDIVVLRGLTLNNVGTAHISDSTINGNGEDGVEIGTNATAHISTSTINDNRNDGIQLTNDATSVVFVTFTTISGNGFSGLNRGGVNSTSKATTIGSNRIFNNGSGSDAFSATITQQ